MKISLFEFEDLSWFPRIFREGMTDYLRYVLSLGNFYLSITPLIVEGLTQTGATRIVDLCSGGGGAIEQIQLNLQEAAGLEVPIVLSDKYPNEQAYRFIAYQSEGRISHADYSVAAEDVPEGLKGFRTIFSGFHHFDAHTAEAVLANTIAAGEGIGIFDGGSRNLLFAASTLLFHPLAFFFLTPFFKPFRWSRLVFTYLIPIIPLCTLWDGLVSIARLRSPEALLHIALKADKGQAYLWKSGKIQGKWGTSVVYLLGYPKPDKA